MKTRNGFTLIELMVALAIAAVLMMLAAPSFTNTIERNQLSTKINELVSTLQYARSESVKRGKQITVCESINGTSCGGAAGYEDGWIIFIDEDADLVFDAGEELLKVHEDLEGFTLRGNNSFDDVISYIPTGATTSANPGHFVLCKNNDTSKSRAMFILTTGRLRLAQDTNYDGIPEDDSGTNITTCTPA